MFVRSNRFRNYAQPFNPRAGYNFASSAKSKAGPTVTWSTDHVFAAAVAAQEQNGEYVKNPAYDPETGKLVRQTNKELMRNMLLNNQQFTEEQKEQGIAVRQHYQGLLFEELSGELRGFLSTALKVATRESFCNRDLLDLAVAAALPGCYQRDLARKAAEAERKELSKNSAPYGAPGQRVKGEFEIVQCNWSQKWNCWTVNAVMGGNLFFFFFKTQLTQGSKVNLAATVKNYRDSNVTQLNRVKVVK